MCRAIGLKKSGVGSGYVDDLRLAGFIAKDYAWDLNSGSEGRQFTYRVKDNYVRFYLKLIAPHQGAIGKNRFRRKKLSALAGWDAVMGLQFENLVLQNRELIAHYILELVAATAVWCRPHAEAVVTRLRDVIINVVGYQ